MAITAKWQQADYFQSFHFSQFLQKIVKVALINQVPLSKVQWYLLIQKCLFVASAFMEINNQCLGLHIVFIYY